MAVQPERAADSNLEEIGIKLLLDGVCLRYVTTISAYQERLLHDSACMQRFVSGVGVNVTSMFREADALRCLREEVIPRLRTYLALGRRESLLFCPESSRYEQVRNGVNLFHKVR